ncbi:EamA family transporter [Aeromicrobium sp. 636]|uniref:EamA family transporter n=1 Tax=Aeromicrobium senzhongii TaxID=2663859 RepID=A0A8I0ETF4_9ACTN|nr:MULTISPECIES: EamA family transporter [Aeromicrobium]MBC9225088.1 EamA family transporter [Aeromicrobium senzhongii]MCQ3997198.1 EamA family transporter [Aeromicrobium sp. 636]
MTAQPATGHRADVSTGALWLALVVVYIAWGSTYLGIRVVVEDMPPLISAGARFLTAAVLMGTFLAARSGPRSLRVRPGELRGAAVVGILLLAGGNGGVVLGERTVPSGLAALLVAMVPLWLILLRFASGARPRLLTWAGVLLGFVGLGVLVLPGGGAGGTATGILLIVGASLSWSVGSFMSQQMAMPANPFVATVWEMLAAAIVLLVLGTARGERPSDSGDASTSSWIALGYLVVFGSIVGYSAYVWLLQNAPLSLVSTYAYVNPVVAVFLGALILAEPITTAILTGGAIVVVGVALVVRAERPARR